MTFRVGQKVVCVRAHGNVHLRLDAIYTVAGLDTDTLFELGLFLAEAWHEDNTIPFKSSRFRPIVERKTDISIFTRMLNSSRENMDA